MSWIISIVNQKGGVGKTTTAINLASSLSTFGKKVLIVDFDAQGNSSRGYGIDISLLNKTIYEALIGKYDINAIIKKTLVKNVDVAPANLRLSNFESETVGTVQDPFKILKNVFSKLTKNYDFILIDCPPSLGLLSINALSASNSALIPVQCEYFAMEGLAQVLSIIKRVQSSFNRDLEIEGFLLTMYETRSTLGKEIVSQVRGLFRENTFNVEIPRNISISESSGKGIPVNLYKPTSAGARAYMQLAKEILENESRRKEEWNCSK